MPILLDDLDKSIISAEPAINPKFFSSELTGSGKSTGLLCSTLLPTLNTDKITIPAETGVSTKHTSTSGDVTYFHIPLDPRLNSTYKPLISHQAISVPTLPDELSLKLELDDANGQPAAGAEAVFTCHPTAIIVRKEKTNGGGNTREVLIHYRMQLVLNDAVMTGFTSVGFTSDPLNEATDFVTDRLVYRQLSLRDDQQIINWLSTDYLIYSQIQHLAEVWASDKIAAATIQVIDDTVVTRKAAPASDVRAAAMNRLCQQLRYLENYQISLEAYKLIHARLVADFDPDDMVNFAKQNLNLLMLDTLTALHDIKPQLQTPAVPANPITLPTHYSVQQRNAITTHDPLTLVQAGAGTGKSTVILERIEYLKACGVDPADINVLSFTTTAAENIKNRNPDIGSMTIAKMVVDIYQENYPAQQVSDVDPMINSLEIYYPNSALAATLQDHLKQVKKNAPGAMTAMNTFIEYNFDGVIEILNTIRQVTLEMQIIIAYQRIDVMKEPAHISSRFLIIDEVQDNSIFEFIYTLRYIAKHKESLFIVGDASQTLYEFRSANPLALNTLESTGVFATHQLTTNYRSNQEVLDFANLTLQNLNTNRIANIRLQANSLQASTAASFSKAITMDYRHAPKISKFVPEELGSIVTNTIAPGWVAERINRGERVCFLAFSRREVMIMKDALEKAFPNETVASLVSDKIYTVDIFSRYIRYFWNEVVQVPPHNAAFALTQGIDRNMDKLTVGTPSAQTRKAIMDNVVQWWISNQAAVNIMVSRAQSGQISTKEFFNQLRANLLDFEVHKNQDKFNLVKSRNAQRRDDQLASNTKLMVSTIHGAKGLEFDHTVVLYKEDPNMPEDKRRMYYVAFTRAMSSSYILAFGLKEPDKSQILAQHEKVIEALEARDTQTSAQLDPDAPVVADDEDIVAGNAAPNAAATIQQQDIEPEEDQPSS